MTKVSTTIVSSTSTLVLIVSSGIKYYLAIMNAYTSSFAFFASINNQITGLGVNTSTTSNGFSSPSSSGKLYTKTGTGNGSVIIYEISFTA